MSENQNVEWKEMWRDEYLKWICGFANAQGGKLVIGINDNGRIIGINNAKSLMESIPTKVRDTMGIIVDVNLKIEKGKEYIEIYIETYPFPISLRGKYYYRSGSTLLELSGRSLDNFMLKKVGKTWDGVPIPYESIDSLSKNAINVFREKALQSGRLSAEDLEVSDEILLKNLQLYEGEYLIRAAIMMFHPNPEKWVQGAYIKIGFFGVSDADLLYQDEIHGPLIEHADKAIDIIYQKYLKALISYDDIQRVETYIFPREGFREILLNAINHKDYSTGIPIQISIYEDKIYVWNDGKLPNEVPVEKLFEKHSSIPFNPKIADVFFKSGAIESWGRGVEKIINTCKKYNNTPIPEYDVSTRGIMVKCVANRKYINLLKEHGLIENQKNEQEDRTRKPNKKTEQENKIIEFCNIPRSVKEIMEHIGMKHRPTFMYNYLTPLIEREILEMTIPEQPRNRKQKYVVKR